MARLFAAAGVVYLLAASPAGAHTGPDADVARLDAEIAASPEDASLWQTRAVFLRRAGDFVRAEADLDRAVALGLDETMAQRDRGLIRFDERRFPEAEALLRAARDRAPGDPPILLAHARTLVALERFDEASATYAELLEQAPKTGPDVRLEQVQTIAAAGTPEALAAAIVAADASIAAIGSVPALEQAALALELRAGHVDAALARLDRIASQMGRRDTILLQRAEVLEGFGRRDAAKAAYAEVIAANQSMPEARRATPAARQVEAQARAAIARLAEGESE